MDTKINVNSKIKVMTGEELNRLLLPGEIGAVLEWKVADKDGRITQHVIKKSESFVQQFLQLLYVQMVCSSPTSTVSIKDTGNVSRSVLAYDKTHMQANAAAGTSTYGIGIGTGAVAPTITDYALGVQIAHGSGAGQMNYGLMAAVAPAADATTSQVTFTRTFSNNSGNPITVNEIGFYVYAYGDSSSRYFMIIRDVIAGGITVPNGQTLTINYRPQAVV